MTVGLWMSFYAMIEYRDYQKELHRILVCEFFYIPLGNSRLKKMLKNPV